MGAFDGRWGGSTWVLSAVVVPVTICSVRWPDGRSGASNFFLPNYSLRSHRRQESWRGSMEAVPVRRPGPVWTSAECSIVDTSRPVVSGGMCCLRFGAFLAASWPRAGGALDCVFIIDWLGAREPEGLSSHAAINR